MTKAKDKRPVIERFSESYHDYHQISPGRRAEQCKTLQEYQAYAGVPIERTNDTHLREFLASLIKSGGHPNTVRKKRNMILPFYGWCFDQRIVSAEVLLRVRRVQNPRGSSGESRPNPYRIAEIQQFWVDLDTSWPRAAALRLHRFTRGTTRFSRVSTHFMRAQINAVAHLALHAGLRRDEIFNASMADLHYDNAYVVVRHGARKNRQGRVKPREVPMTKGLEQALTEWFDLRELVMQSVTPDKRHNRPWLCLAANQPQDTWAKPIWHDRFGELLATVGNGYGLHRMRHTCGTEWLRSGLALEHVSKLLGHSRMQQTLAYAQILKTDLEKGMGAVAVDFQLAVGRPEEKEEKAA